MTFAGKRRLTESATDPTSAASDQLAPGKRTLTQMLPASGGAAAATPGNDPRVGQGQPLPGGLREQMEGSFGADFSGVRVFDDGSADSMGAHAYAQGNELHFGTGRYEPESSAGRDLIGHELTHVMQQRSGQVGPAAQPRGGHGAATSSLEQQAEDLGARAARGETGLWPHAAADTAPPSSSPMQFSRPIGATEHRKDGAFRSRYSGAPLVDNTMVVTISAQGSQAFWHSYIVFEWFDPHINQRHHHLFHLYPAKNPEGKEYTSTEKATWGTGEKDWGVPGIVDWVQEQPEFLPQRDEKQAVIPTNYRSWETDYAAGEKAFNAAKAFVASPPRYTVHGYGQTMSCATFATTVAAKAGIQAGSILGTLIEIPRYENAGALPVQSEGEMWQDRGARERLLGEIRSIPEPQRVASDATLITAIENQSISVEEAKTRLAKTERPQA